MYHKSITLQLVTQINNIGKSHKLLVNLIIICFKVFTAAGFAKNTGYFSVAIMFSTLIIT